MTILLPIMLLLIIEVVVVAALVLCLRPMGAFLHRMGDSISRMAKAGEPDKPDKPGVPGVKVEFGGPSMGVAPGEKDQPAQDDGRGKVLKTVIVACVGLVVFIACLNIFRISLVFLTVSLTSILRMKAMGVSMQALLVMSYLLSAITAFVTALYVRNTISS